MLIVLAIVLFVLLPSPWSWVALVVCLLLALIELLVWSRFLKRRRVTAGAETLIGATAKVALQCRPYGQVTLEGERWEARCEAGADPGELVTVVARDRLVLIVEPKQAAGS